MSGDEKCFGFAFEGRESRTDVLWEIVLDVETEVLQISKSMGFAVEALSFIMRQTPSTGLRHPSFSALPYLGTPYGPENCQLTSSFLLVLKQ